MGNYTIFQKFENPRRGRQARYFTTNVPKILDLKSSSEQLFSKNCRWVPLREWGGTAKHSHAQKQLRRQLLRLIESVCSPSSTGFPNVKWRLANSRAREASEKRERGMMGTSVERERGVMGSLYVHVGCTSVYTRYQPTNRLQTPVSFYRAREENTLFFTLARTSSKFLSFHQKKNRCLQRRLAYFSTNINILPTIFRYNQVERLPELIK